MSCGMRILLNVSYCLEIVKVKFLENNNICNELYSNILVIGLKLEI